MAGTLVRAEPPKKAAPIPLRKNHCEHCYQALGAAECRAGTYSNLAVYAKLRESRVIPHEYVLVSERREYGAAWTLNIVASFDDTVWSNPLHTARFMLNHLQRQEQEQKQA